ncbi:MAG: methionyl-tRNA formyltransferase [Parcubacteria group bacterium CG23_combo_of_CG06-09_8_20_14_all_35_9]|nr:MAG: methionyl-tRNA formyltransferase [Parcubacteria group bacterium CG23_combo_of_CG06-09_8_20_14_all_35_9]
MSKGSKFQNSNFKLLFMGTPDFARIILKALIIKGFSPVAVVTSPDKPIGRKQILTPSPVKKVALKYNIPVFQSFSVKDSNLKSKILNLKCDLIIVAAYGQILPKEILEIPKLSCVNVHASLLPKYRGSSPIQAAILAGEKETGVTIMLMDEGMDTGDILAQAKLKIAPQETAASIHNKLAKLGAATLIKTLPKWLKGEITPLSQKNKEATYTKILTRQDGKIDWGKSAQEIERMIRAYTPWPGTFALLKIIPIQYLHPDDFFPISISKLKEIGIPIHRENKNKKIGKNKNEKLKRIKILRARAKDLEIFLPSGKIFLTKDKELAVSCGKGYLILEKVQMEGKKEITSQEFIRGHKEIIGNILG